MLDKETAKRLEPASEERVINLEEAQAMLESLLTVGKILQLIVAKAPRVRMRKDQIPDDIKEAAVVVDLAPSADETKEVLYKALELQNGIICILGSPQRTEVVCSVVEGLINGAMKEYGEAMARVLFGEAKK